MASEIEKDEQKSAAGTKGGHARAEALSKVERVEIATRAAAARWGGPVPTATHVGGLMIGETAIPCAVLEDGTRLLTEAGFLVALGRSPKPKGRSQRVSDGLPPFLNTKSLKGLITQDIIDSTVPIVFRTTTGGRASGYRAELLPKVCNLFLAARKAGMLTVQQEGIADKAEIVVRALAEIGIVALVDEATGYQEVRPKDALQRYLEMILRKELAAWAKKFPDEFYENIYKLKGWIWPGMGKNRYSVVAHYTRDLIYDRLAPGLLKELESRSPKNEKGARPNKLHQWLTDDIGNPLLAQHMHSILMFQRLAIANGYGWQRFLRMVNQVMPKKGQTLELPFPDEALQA